MTKDSFQPIYDGSTKDFTWVGFGSGAGTNLAACAQITSPAFIFTDRPKSKLLSSEALQGIDKIVFDGFKACGKSSAAGYAERSRKFNEKICTALEEYERAYQKEIDLLVLGGYMRMVTGPLLEKFRDRIITVHPADLTVLNETHERVYTGAYALYDAIAHGVQATRSSVILVNEGMDQGEILVQGPEFQIDYGMLAMCDGKNLKHFATMIQDEQKKQSDWPAIKEALKLIQEGRLAIGQEKQQYDAWRTVYVDGKKCEYGGRQLVK